MNKQQQRRYEPSYVLERFMGYFVQKNIGFSALKKKKNDLSLRCDLTDFLLAGEPASEIEPIKVMASHLF